MKSGFRLPVLSGLLLGVGYYLPPLILVAFVPLLCQLESHHAPPRRHALKSGFVFGFVAYLIGLHFLYTLLVWTWLPALLYVSFAAVLALRTSLSMVLLDMLRRRTGLPHGLLLPLCWLPFEWLQTFGDLRMTADHLTYGLASLPFLIQFADLVGHYGIGAFVLAVNGLVFGAVYYRGAPRRRSMLALATLLVAVLSYDLWAWVRPEPESPDSAGPLRIALIQPNIPLTVKRLSDASATDQWTALVQMTREAAASQPDLIVWPETANPYPLFYFASRPETYAMPGVEWLASQTGVPMLVGVEYLEVRNSNDFDLYNAAIAVDAEGRIDPNWVAKVYLVPFVEAMPLRSLLGPLLEGRDGQWQWVTGGFQPGPRDDVLTIDGVRLGVLVCYEQLFPDRARRLRLAGAEIGVVITNDAWFGRSLFQRYQADALRVRAIENRMPFVRVANTGISGFVDSRGRYDHRTRLFEEAIEVHDVRRATVLTLYHRIGDAVAWLAALGLVGALVAARFMPRLAASARST